MPIRKRKVNNTTGLQVFNTLRFVTFLVISIVFTKIGLSKEEIGLFEISVFIVGVASFFWITGLIQSFIPLYNNSTTFGNNTHNPDRKSPEIFNAYILLLAISIIIFIIGLSIQNNFSVFGHKGKVPLLNVTLWYLLLSSPACMVEYIYMLRNRSSNTITYAYLTYSLQLILVIVPAWLGYGVIWSLRGLVVVAIVRNIWLITLLINYAEFKISIKFIKEHLKLAAPLILSVLISGSAQYIDGLVVSIHYAAEGFAIFRYGAKELPFVVMLAAGLSSAMLAEFSVKEKISETLSEIKKRSLRIMHIMYPLSIVLLFFAKPIYSHMFSMEFTRSADVFVVYLLAIFGRLLFPNTILIGLKKTKVILIVSVIEVVANLILSLWFVEIYGVVGVALATVIVYGLTKILLIIYNYFKLGIKPTEY
ncbi:MAG: polysaccharide biosynthesis C-terminal domain-containing protein, partial [Bacteroidota bacterium]|nr:polysaccharide biosynthesis C-terminal domain-containing protein [Bacteroidota bacterium]